MTASRAILDSEGLIGPFSLSADGLACLVPLLSQVSQQVDENIDPRNLHERSDMARAVISDVAIRMLVSRLFGAGYRLWRTNFFQRQSGSPHPGVAWHHDKHFQHADNPIDFQECGAHLSLVIALDAIDQSNGCFRYIPATHLGELSGFQRDCRPFDQRPISDHFLSLPASLETTAVELSIPAGHFCLFHSALLHGSSPSAGDRARTSMVGRLVRRDCLIPTSCARHDQVLTFC